MNFSENFNIFTIRDFIAQYNNVGYKEINLYTIYTNKNKFYIYADLWINNETINTITNKFNLITFKNIKTFKGYECINILIEIDDKNIFKKIIKNFKEIIEHDILTIMYSNTIFDIKICEFKFEDEYEKLDNTFHDNIIDYIINNIEVYNLKTEFLFEQEETTATHNKEKYIVFHEKVNENIKNDVHNDYNDYIVDNDIF